LSLARGLLPASVGLLACWAFPAAAGPPYVTDDPQPTDQGHWEVYNFLAGGHVAGVTAGEGGLDLNYGAAKDVQVTAVFPFAYERSDRTRTGAGVVELAVKYKVLHQAPGGLPDVAFFPRVFLPTAPARFASRRANLLLPVWAQKDYGPWSVFGGAGYQISPGPDGRNFWTGGVAVTRAMGERLSLGAEITHHSADAPDGRPFTGLNLGGAYKLGDHWSVLASGGPGLQNAREEGRYDFYVSLKADY
jgi:hypothetical protein